VVPARVRRVHQAQCAFIWRMSFPGVQRRLRKAATLTPRMEAPSLRSKSRIFPRM
jgi:hypothetical protein